MTSSFKIRGIPMFLLLALAGACERGEVSPDTAGLSAAGDQRIHAGIITFSKWNDYVQLDAAVTKTEAGACELLDPRVQDDTTRWQPLQLYWVVVDKPSDATMGKRIAGIYYDEDLVEASAFNAHGFAPIKPQYADMLPLSDLRLTEDRSQLTAELGGIFAARLSLKTTATETGCQTVAAYCRTTGSDCAKPADFRPLKRIHVKQNLLGYPSQVTFE